MNKKSKQILAVLMCMAAITTGCGKQTPDTNEKSNEETMLDLNNITTSTTWQNSNDEITYTIEQNNALSDNAETQSTVPESKPPFEGTSDMAVSFAYMNQRYTNIIVENTSDKVILDYKVAYIQFDKNGFSVSSNQYEGGSITAANLLPGDKEISSFYGVNGKYVVATIVYIRYQGDETWEANNIEAWADNTIKNFTVDGYKESINALKDKAVLAETNEYVEIVSTEKYHDNQFSNKDDLSFTLKNISSNTIESATLCLLEYDENGLAIPTSPHNTYAKNDHVIGGTINLLSDTTNSFIKSLFFEPTCEKYKCIVKDIVFSDGTEWTNPYVYEWIFCNCDQF